MRERKVVPSCTSKLRQANACFRTTDSRSVQPALSRCVSNCGCASLCSLAVVCRRLSPLSLAVPAQTQCTCTLLPQADDDEPPGEPISDTHNRPHGASVRPERATHHTVQQPERVRTQSHVRKPLRTTHPGPRPRSAGPGDAGVRHVCTPRVQQVPRMNVHRTHKRSHAAHASNEARHSRTQYTHATEQSTSVTPARRQAS